MLEYRLLISVCKWIGGTYKVRDVTSDCLYANDVGGGEGYEDDVGSGGGVCVCACVRICICLRMRFLGNVCVCIRIRET